VLCRCAAVCLGDDEEQVGAEADPVRICLRKVLPVIAVQLFRDPDEPVRRVEVGLDALGERCAADEARHRGRMYKNLGKKERGVLY
jgi:hypothetical protein